MFKLKLFYQCIAVVLLLVVTIQCKNNTAVNDIDVISPDEETQNVNPKDIAKIKYTEYVLSDLAEAKTKDWLTFLRLNSQIETFKKGDFAFVKNDKVLLKSFITDLKNEIPESLNRSPISVRLSVIETTLYKLEETLNIASIEKAELLNAIKDVLLAHNNLIFQINKILEKESRNIEKPQ